MSPFEFIFNLFISTLLPFILGGVVIGSIVRAVDNRSIRDLKILLQGFGVLREEKPRWGLVKALGHQLWPKVGVGELMPTHAY